MPTRARRWDRLAEEREFTQLDDLRSATEQWRNGIGALTGALGTASILKGADAFRDLPGAWQYAAVSSAILGLILLVVATGFAMRAAVKQPALLLNSGEDLRRWVDSEVHETLSSPSTIQAHHRSGPGGLAMTLLLSWVITPSTGSPASVQLRRYDEVAALPPLRTRGPGRGHVVHWHCQIVDALE